MTSPLRVALLGAGWIAEEVYLPPLRGTPGMVLTEVCDPLPERARRVASAVSTARAGIDPLAAIAGADAAIICAPAGAHLSLILAVLGAGKFAFCEKPVLRTREELAALRASGGQTRLMGSATMRLRDDVTDWLDWIRSGQIGRLRRLQLSWHRHQGVPAPGSWRTAASDSPTGVLEDLGSHLLDVAAGALQAAGLSPLAQLSPRRLTFANCSGGRAAVGPSWFERSSACYDAPDRFCTVAAIAEDCELDLSVRWTDPEPGDIVRLEAEGTDGRAELEGLFGYSSARRCPEQTCTLRRGVEVLHKRYDPGPEHQQRAFAAALQRFAAFCAGKAEPISSSREIGLVAGWLGDLRRAGALEVAP